jgi:hypothetical protein
VLLRITYYMTMSQQLFDREAYFPGWLASKWEQRAGPRRYNGPWRGRFAEPASLKHPPLLHDLLKHNECS